MKRNNKPKSKKVEKLGFGYVDVEEIVRKHQIKHKYKDSQARKKRKDNIIINQREHLFDLEKKVSDNLCDGKDKYLIVRVSEKENVMEIIPDEFSKLLTTPKALLKENVPYLRHIFTDYDTIFGTRYNQFKNYNPKFFDVAERVLFEVLLIKFKRNKFEPFIWSQNKIEYELGIKRVARNGILDKFKELGILKVEVLKEKVKKTQFTLYPKRIINLIPEIYSDLNLEKVEKDLIKYLGYKKK